MASRKVTKERLVDAAPDTVAAVITSPHGLSSWLCDTARSEKRADGSLELEWQGARHLFGRWTAFDPPERLAWHCRDVQSGAEQSVEFRLSPEGDGTKLTVTEDDVDEESAGDVAAAWAQALEDLQMLAEEGLDGREARQPMLGIMPEELEPDAAERLGVPVESGIRISGLVDDGAAGEAGMMPDDVIVAIADDEVSGWSSLGAALRSHSAGDKVRVRFWRGNEEHDQELELKSRTFPEVPETLGDIREEVVRVTADVKDRIAKVFEGVTDEEAQHSPAEGEWNAKQVLVHLSLSERFGNDWLIRLASDAQPIDWPGSGFELMSEALATRPLEELIARYLSDLGDTESLLLTVLDREHTPWVRRTVATNGHWTLMHVEDHIGQIQEAVESARSGTAGPD